MAKFAEFFEGEVRRILILRTRVNKPAIGSGGAPK
jgi:hypothetical protein